MITKVTKDNKGLYKTLFTQAGIALNQGPDAISSLDEYFSCFKSLADLDAVFAVLPPSVSAHPRAHLQRHQPQGAGAAAGRAGGSGVRHDPGGHAAVFGAHLL